MIITIDGPAASGKSTLARLLAAKLGYYYLSSGLLFRGLAYVLMHEYHYHEEQFNNPREKDIQNAINRLEYAYDPREQEQLFFDGKNITLLLRDPQISRYSSILAPHAIVRAALNEWQHRIAASHSLVAEGRDMGSVVFPGAQVKFYLTASLEIRAQRWLKDQQSKGRSLSLAQAQEEIRSRDERDLNRSLAPLCVPQRAIIIDDSDLTKEQALAYILKEVEQALKRAKKNPPFGSMEA
jgi:CMP/dCMP kinase